MNWAASTLDNFSVDQIRAKNGDRAAASFAQAQAQHRINQSRLADLQRQNEAAGYASYAKTQPVEATPVSHHEEAYRRQAEADRVAKATEDQRKAAQLCREYWQAAIDRKLPSVIRELTVSYGQARGYFPNGFATDQATLNKVIAEMESEAALKAYDLPDKRYTRMALGLRPLS